jgi:hypothetical protein
VGTQEGGGGGLVVGDVAREGAGGGADVGGMAVERAAAVLTWHTKRWRRLPLMVMWHIVGLWMHDEVGGGGQRGCNSPVDPVSWSARAQSHAPYVVVVFESGVVVVVFESVVVVVRLRWRHR